MREAHLKHLVCPDCREPLVLDGHAKGGEIREGTLNCPAGCRFPIIEHVPRFVPEKNYAAGFGLEWTHHAITQYDSHSGIDLSANRFFAETGWPRNMVGEILIEPGSGGGRFTEQAASTGAMVLSLDYSAAVDANYRLNGRKPNILIVQGDIYRMPFPHKYADRVFCSGVLQHTPDPKLAFLSLTRYLKPGGQLAADVYIASFGRRWTQTKYLVRPITRRMEPERLYRYVRHYINAMWPLASLIRRIPKIGPSINWRLLIADYSNHGLTGKQLKEWAYLDTFDMLSPRYDSPQTVQTVRGWLEESELEGRVFEGMNGVGVLARRPAIMPVPLGSSDRRSDA
jgi:SAM-dependent methyltransferase